MRKTFTLITLMILFLGSISFATNATATLPTMTANPGDAITVPINVTDFTSVGSISLMIAIDPAILNYTGISNVNVLTPGLTANFNAGTSSVDIAWNAGSSSLPTINGLLCNLQFVYNGPGTSTMVFAPGCQVTTGIPPVELPVTYTNGQVSPFTGNASNATISTLDATPGQFVTVPLVYSGFSTSPKVGAITQKITFDPAKLTFVSITAHGNLASAVAYASGSTLTIEWSNPLGADINGIANDIWMNFVYNGPGNCDLSFAPGCIISNTLTANIGVNYHNGAINQASTSITAVLGSVTANQGDDVFIPLTFTNMPANTAAVSLHLPFDYPKLSFVGVTGNIHGASVNLSGNAVNIAWEDYSHPDINGVFLNLKFHYTGIGTANITFGPGCMFSDITLNPINVAFTSATVTQIPAVPTITIASATAQANSDVDVPITFALLPSNIGAVSMYIGYDNTKLTPILPLDAAHNPNNASIWLTSGQVNIMWNSILPTGDDVNGIFITMKFHYLGGGITPLVFNPGCEIANAPLAQIVYVNWINGSVSSTSKVSGNLTYDSHPNPVLAIGNATVYLKDGPEPIPPSITPVPNILYTTTTDASGYFEFHVPNGTYYLYASCSDTWAGVGLPDVTNLRRYIAGLTPNTVDDALRVLAADINQDGTVDLGDVSPLRRQIAELTPNPNYLIPNWLFENFLIPVSGADILQNFYGICSGDLNGSYPDPNGK